MPGRLFRLDWYRKRWLVLLITFVVLGPLAWAMMDRTIPVLVYNGRITQDGDTLFVDWTVFATRNCAGTSRRRIIDSAGTIWDQAVVPAIAEAFTPPHEYHLVREVKLSPGIALGPIFPRTT